MVSGMTTTNATNGHEPPPIACSLSAADYQQRAAEIRRLARDALRGRQPIAGGTRLIFAAAPGVAERLAGVVAAESRCCAFLTLELERVGADLVLDVTGPAEAAPIIEELFA
jgi:MerR family transcriptional regulator, copper efflux regulator